MKDEGKRDLVGNNTVNLKTSAWRRQDRNARNTSLYALKWPKKGENVWLRCSPEEVNGDYVQNNLVYSSIPY